MKIEKPDGIPPIEPVSPIKRAEEQPHRKQENPEKSSLSIEQPAKDPVLSEDEHELTEYEKQYETLVNLGSIPGMMRETDRQKLRDLKERIAELKNKLQR